ncbi:MAG: hypothetical protein WDN03_18335 [Rhizomicrobium sp.]
MLADAIAAARQACARSAARSHPDGSDDRGKAEALLADSACDSRAFREAGQAIGAKPVIPSNPPASILSGTTEQPRNRIERCFDRFKHSDASPFDTAGATTSGVHCDSSSLDLTLKYSPCLAKDTKNAILACVA